MTTNRVSAEDLTGAVSWNTHMWPLIWSGHPDIWWLGFKCKNWERGKRKEGRKKRGERTR